MKDVNISWEYRSVADAGGSSVATVLKHVDLSISADSGNSFAFLDNVVPPARSFFIEALDAGDYILRTKVVDVNDAITQTVDTPFKILDETLPSQILNVSVILS
jgi:hypothetical protein